MESIMDSVESTVGSLDVGTPHYGKEQELLQATFNLSKTPVLCNNQEAWGISIVIVEVLLIWIGNFTVLAVVLKYPAKKFRPLNWFIFHLAVSDLCVGGITLWIGFLSAKVFATVTLPSGIIVYGALACFTSTSTLGVLYIAFDRYAYILKHNNYKTIMSKQKVLLALLFAWIAPFLLFIVAPISGWNCIQTCNCEIFNRDESTIYCFGDHCSQMMTPFYKSTILVGGICLFSSLAASCVIYSAILLQVQHKTSLLEQKLKSKQRKKSEMQMIKTMLIVLSGFLLTTGPLALLCITSFFYNARPLHNAMRVMVVISNINSILNPAFYFWRISYMKNNLRKFVNCILFFVLNTFCGCCHNETIVSMRKRSSATETMFFGGRDVRDRSESSITMSVKLAHFRNIPAHQQNISSSSIGN